jgi:hypothetical protein
MDQHARAGRLAGIEQGLAVRDVIVFTEDCDQVEDTDLAAEVSVSRVL